MLSDGGLAKVEELEVEGVEDRLETFHQALEQTKRQLQQQLEEQQQQNKQQNHHRRQMEKNGGKKRKNLQNE